ncbi:MAG: universal stress protein [Salinarimonadaceae bacterium]|nr:MAG: universal stress protein [Salinarimonadaceae bacterium]
MIKDVMVHLDGSEADAERLALAEILADAHAAHIEGIFVNRMPSIALAVDATGAGAEIMGTLTEQAIADGDVIEKRLASRLEACRFDATVTRVDAMGEQGGEIATRAARHADLFLATRLSEGEGGEDWSELIHAVIFGSGRGVLLAAPGVPARPFRRIVVGWNASREASRALAEAGPFLRAADEVVVATAERASSGDAPDTRIARHLDRHGVKVTLHDIRSRDPADAIIAEAESRDADLIVTGAYGQSRLRQWALGGVTRELLRRAPVPLFLAH